MTSNPEGGAAGDGAAVARSLRLVLDRVRRNSSSVGGAAADKRALSSVRRAVAAVPEALLPVSELDELRRGLEVVLVAGRVPDHRFEFVLEMLSELVGTPCSARHKQVG
jgi:hypothetical protein